MAEIGNLFVVAAPSGAGKTSLVKAIVDSTPNVTVSISHTTRLMRPGETDGLNYYFIGFPEFQHMIDHQDFLEHAAIFGNHYGTSKKWVKQTLAKGIDIILEIDWQGQQQIKRLFPSTISIFILPPSFQALHKRLIHRNQDHADVIKKRLADARETVSHLPEFDYIVVNDDFAQTTHDLKTIIEASRFLRAQQVSKYAKLIEDLMTP
jgi:guanylate kinase